MSLEGYWDHQDANLVLPLVLLRHVGGGLPDVLLQGALAQEAPGGPEYLNPRMIECQRLKRKLLCLLLFCLLSRLHYSSNWWVTNRKWKSSTDPLQVQPRIEAFFNTGSISFEGNIIERDKGEPSVEEKNDNEELKKIQDMLLAEEVEVSDDEEDDGGIQEITIDENVVNNQELVGSYWT